MIENTWKQDAAELDRSGALSAADDQQVADAPEIPGYKVIEKLGQGQYGSVWKALDLNAMIPVAIKIFRQSGGLDLAMLRGEVEKLIVLSEEQRIVGLREVGWDAEPPFFVMDYLENSLEKRLRDGSLSVEESVQMFGQIVAGLVYAHNKGIMHCDLKPGNILLDHDSQPRIADFGQSRLSTQQSPALGTLFYMAPEQADLKGVPDARWDVYAAGAVLYCMLTGAAPHQSEETRRQLAEADTASAVLARYQEIIRNSPKPTEHHGIVGVDRSLVEIIDRCLEKNPNRRYANAQALREAMQRRSRWLRQKPVLALGIALPLVFVLLMAGGFWYEISKAKKHAIDNLIQTAEDSNRTFAAAVHGSVARQFDRRWRSLSSLGEKTEFRQALQEWSRQAAELRSQLAADEYQKQVADLPSARLLHEKTERYLGAEYQGTRGIAWFAQDADGFMAAFAAQRESAASFIGRDFKHRDYFRGVMENPDGPDVYVSRAFHPLEASGHPEKHHVVVFAVPVFDRDAEHDGPKPGAIGVLAMAVPVGDFFELQYSNLETDEAQARRYADYQWIPQIATLIDTRSIEPATADAPPGDAGLVLHHAFYRLYGAEWYDDRYEDFPQITMPPAATEVLQDAVTQAEEKSNEFEKRFKLADTLPSIKAVQAEKRRLAAQRNAELAQLYAEMESVLAASFADPFGHYDSRFDATQWVVSARPLVVQRPGKAGLTLTRLVVLVQQRRDVVIRPAREMASNMQKTAVVLFAIAGALMLIVWFYGFTLLNPASQSRFTRAIMRITGLRTTRSARASGTGTGTGLSTRTGASAGTPDTQ